MALAPIAFTIPQYEDYPNYWMKAYEQGTDTPKTIATDSGGLTTLAKCELDTSGFPLAAANTRFIPFIDGSYDLWLFPTEIEANKNITANAIQIADNINAGGTYLTQDNSVAPSAHFLPTTDNLYNFGSALKRWVNGFFSGSISVGGNATVTGDVSVGGNITGPIGFTGVATLPEPIINTGISGTAILDEDDMSSDSDTKLATQQSIKAYISTKTASLNTKILEIGDWNMDTTQNVSVAHGIADFTKIRSVDVMIIDDTGGGALWPLSFFIGSGTGLNGYNIDGTNITLYRLTSGQFDGVSFDLTPYNRGWITIHYVD